MASRVLDILEGRAEQEKVLYDCPDFILVPDMKWDLTTISSLYICAIARVEGLRSLIRGHLVTCAVIYQELGCWSILE